ncbi:MAG: hypothetical protein ABFR05_09335 [Bacteroidota bacterium]
MLIRLVIAIVSVMVFASCDFISLQNSSSQNLSILDTVIDYNSVDVYPVFRECNNCDSNQKLNLCFENEFVKNLEKIVNKNEAETKKEIFDTVYVDILVDNTGRITISKIHKSSEVIKDIPKFDSILQQSIAKLPKTIQPSLKRGIPVNSVFKLPVIVSVRSN